MTKQDQTLIQTVLDADALVFAPTPKPTSSIWGPVQSAKEIIPGMWHVTTASHGGIIVSAQRLDAMPPCARETRYSHGGQFEEDCDWAIPIVCFPSEVGADLLSQARASIRGYAAYFVPFVPSEAYWASRARGYDTSYLLPR